MKIAIINPVRADISGGYREYLNQFLTRAEADPRIDSILFLSIPSVCSSFGLFNKKVKFGDIGPWYHFNPNNSTLRKNLTEFEPDLIYSPVEKKISQIDGIPRVIMVQNMEPLVPTFSCNSLLQNLRIQLLKRMAIKAIRNCDYIIALSNFVSEQLVRQYAVSENMIKKIPHGAEFKSDMQVSKPVTVNADDVFIFTAGTISPARGLEDIIKAFIELKKVKHNSNLKLYIAGSVQRYSKKYFSMLQKLIRQAYCEKDVCWLGFVSQSEMKWCYQHCRLFVMTSRVESFGIIALEAMTYGAPVISSTSPCLPEVFGEYALYYNPGDFEELSKNVDALLKRNKDITHDSRCLINDYYDWDRIYNETILLFMELVSRNTQSN